MSILDTIPEFRRYIIDLTAIGVAYVGLLAAAAVLLGQALLWLRARRQAASDGNTPKT